MKTTVTINITKTEESFEVDMNTQGAGFTVEDTANIAIVLLPSLIVEILKDLPTIDPTKRVEKFEAAIMQSISAIMWKFIVEKEKQEKQENEAKPQTKTQTKTQDKPWGLDCDCETEA